jgi:hypothetical protein
MDSAPVVSPTKEMGSDNDFQVRVSPPFPGVCRDRETVSPVCQVGRDFQSYSTTGPPSKVTLESAQISRGSPVSRFPVEIEAVNR